MKSDPLAEHLPELLRALSELCRDASERRGRSDPISRAMDEAFYALSRANSLSQSDHDKDARDALRLFLEDYQAWHRTPRKWAWWNHKAVARIDHIDGTQRVSFEYSEPDKNVVWSIRPHVIKRSGKGVVHTFITGDGWQGQHETSGELVI